MSKKFNRESFFDALSQSITTVQLDGFGPVNLRQISVADADRIRTAAKDEAGEFDPTEFGLRLLAASIVSDDGDAVFTDADVKALSAASTAKIDGLIARVLELNGFTQKKPAG